MTGQACDTFPNGLANHQYRCSAGLEVRTVVAAHLVEVSLSAQEVKTLDFQMRQE